MVFLNEKLKIIFTVCVLTIRSTCRRGMHALACRGTQWFCGSVVNQQQFSIMGESRGMCTAPQVSSSPLAALCEAPFLTSSTVGQ